MKKRTKLVGIGLVCAVVLIPVAWILLVRLEGTAPTLRLDPEPAFIGASETINLSVADSQSGLRSLWVALNKDGREVEILNKQYGGDSFLGGGEALQDSLTLTLDIKKKGLSDGGALLRVRVADFSWRNWWNGNQTYFEKQVVIDTKAPLVDVLSQQHNINQGGTGLVIYRLSEACPNSGVKVGENFFAGRSGYFKNPLILTAYFALKHTQGPGTPLAITATDEAGNQTQKGFPYHIKKRVFKKDVLNISDNFLNWKMPEFASQIPNGDALSAIEKFLYVNGRMRAANYKTVGNLGKQSENVQYWQGAFARLPNSARQAGFADRRTYKHNGKVIDHQVHLGIDLASLAQSKVPAANRGRVLIADTIGIYGNTVVLDHGFGLMSMYSHLSRIDVTVGQMVDRGDTIGLTGRTGMAGGDHLHFSILVDHTFVNPVEWWDAKWIASRITRKIEEVKRRFDS